MKKLGWVKLRIKSINCEKYIYILVWNPQLPRQMQQTNKKKIEMRKVIDGEWYKQVNFERTNEIHIRSDWTKF